MERLRVRCNPNHALESVCQDAITQLMTQCNDEVDDTNYSQVTAPHRKLHGAKTFENIFKEKDGVGMRYIALKKQSRNIKMQYNGLVLAREQQGELVVALADLKSMELNCWYFVDRTRTCKCRTSY